MISTRGIYIRTPSNSILTLEPQLSCGSMRRINVVRQIEGDATAKRPTTIAAQIKKCVRGNTWVIETHSAMHPAASTTGQHQMPAVHVTKKAVWEMSNI